MMVEPDAPRNNGSDTQSIQSQGQLRDLRSASSSSRPIDLSIPKNRSTGNLLAYAASARGPQKIRFSFDSGPEPQEYETMSRSPVMPEHDHGIGASGLRRIRQQPPARNSTLPSEPPSRNTSLSRSTSMILDIPSGSRKSSHGALGSLTPGPSSPNFTEDLTRFPSESLHSFSFAHQSEDFIHNRQNVLKRSIEFMKDRVGMGWPSVQNAGIASAQARVSGDQEMQSMLELLSKANLMGKDNQSNGLGLVAGPLTGPALTDGGNIFERNFTVPQSQSPELMESPVLSPTRTRDDPPPELCQDPASNTATQATEPGRLPRTIANESTNTRIEPALTRRTSLKRTYTDVSAVTLKNKLIEAMAQPYSAKEATDPDHLLMPTLSRFPTNSSLAGSHPNGPVVHGHSSRWSPAAQAIFTTESKAPWTILAANDLACLVFGVTKAEVRKMGIMEVVREERRAWLQEKLAQPGFEPEPTSGVQSRSQSRPASPTPTTSFLLGGGGGITAKLLSKPSSRSPKPDRRAKTDDGAGSSIADRKKATKGGINHPANNSRGVLLCGDVVPIQKRNGQTGAASLWVKEKKHGLIWVLEEIHEDFAIVSLDEEGEILKMEGATTTIWGEDDDQVGSDVSRLLPRLPRQGSDGRSEDVDWVELARLKYFTCRNADKVNIPAVVEKLPRARELRVSSFPHIAGIMCLSASTLQITSSNAVFSAALFGQAQPDGLHITELIPGFDKILDVLVEEDGVDLVDGMVIPEHSFRRARAFLALKEKRSDAANYFSHPDSLPAKHRDGQDIKIDVQMRVVKSERHARKVDEHVILEEDEEEAEERETEIIYALWVTYSRQLHATRQIPGVQSPLLSGLQTPLHPGQNPEPAPIDMDSDEAQSPKEKSHAALLTEQLAAAARSAAAVITHAVDFTSSKESQKIENSNEKVRVIEVVEPPPKKTIADFAILEEMGQGAYGQVKLARYKRTGNKVVLKYVTKRRILVDTWTRDRRLGTVPLEIHVLDFLRRDNLKHANIVEMADFFEDDVNYYIEMIPHGLPGMDLFDYIELRVNMEEDECRSIFLQVANAVHHLHTKALVVHRDIKDENVVLDGEGNIKLIDFGSAAYIKNGPFDVFVGTIDYAAPEVLAGKPYRGKEQDVWALGILLYTIVYKENPFYSIDEIMDRDLRVPYVMSDDSIDLIRGMLDREVGERLDIEGVLNHKWLAGIEGNDVS